MRLVIISDTHCTQPNVPDGDVLIHCGDFTFHGRAFETKDSLEWFNSLPHKHKLFTAGNHELGWEDEVKRNVYLDWASKCTYLHATGVEIDGVKFWGSPFQPDFMGWAFQLPRGNRLKEHWSLIPDDTDVLITHGPPYGFGDTNGDPRDFRFGDKDLLARVLEVKPDVHCYGHAHGGYGQWFFEGIHFINAALLNESYMLANQPVVVDL